MFKMDIIQTKKQMLLFVFTLLASIPFGSMYRCLGCGFELRAPDNHFDGVNERGFVSYWETIDTLDLGEGLKLPLVINFRSNRESTSPYLGKSWLLALLEASLVQTGDDSFQMEQPDGWNNYFMRNKTDDTVLQGAGGWKAEIKGDIVSAWAACGWRIDFYRGKIQSLTTPQNRKLEFVRAGVGNIVTEIRENGTAKLTVEQESTGEVKALLFNGKRMEIALDQKPRVQNIAGQNVVGGIDRSLKSLSPTDGPSKTFEFAVNDKVQPTLKITSKAGIERVFTWDATTKRIVSDNDWTYQITSASSIRTENVGIKRNNSKGQHEYWFQDKVNGIETTVGIDGIRTIKERFTSGIVGGHVRSVRTYDSNGNLLNEKRNSYNEYGKLLRITDSTGVREIRNYDKNRNIAWIWRNSEFVQYVYKSAPEWKAALDHLPKDEKENIEAIAEAAQIHYTSQGTFYAFSQLNGRLVADISKTKLRLYHQQSASNFLQTITKTINQSSP